MARKHVHHWIVETPEEAQERWEELGYNLGTKKKIHRKLLGYCRKRGCSEKRYYPLDGGLVPFTAKRRGPQRKKGEGVFSSWYKPL